MMPSAGADASDRFTMVCLKCDRPIIARTPWVGRELQCPHCAAPMCVPPPRDDGQPVRALPPRVVSQPQRFNFSCPRCKSLLESHAGMCGQTGRCPTCAARFVIPHVNAPSGVSQAARLIDDNDQHPTPMHAYAASGHQAPRIHRLEDGTLEIECPRCGSRCDMAADNCPRCGVPFTIEGVPTAGAPAGDSLATTALVLGIIAIPLCTVLVPAGLAIIFGLASWLRRAAERPSGHAIAGIILGLVSLGLGLMIHLL